MLYYNRIDLSEGKNVAKSNNCKECIVCYYWIFNHRVEFQDSVCNGCHDLTWLCLNLSGTATITVKKLILADISNKFIRKFYA